MNDGMQAKPTNEIAVGFFPDFQDPTLLISGTAEGLRQLAAILQSLGRGEARRIELSKASGVRFLHEMTVTLIRSDNASEICRLGDESALNFELRCSPEDAFEFAEFVLAVSRFDKPSHTYLGFSKAHGVMVLVSKGEYPSTWPPPC